MRASYKSVALCPSCGAPMVLSANTGKQNLDKDAGEHFIIHYTTCTECGTRCRTTTTSVVIRHGDKKPPEQPALFVLA